jgi:hypothetical protein
MAQKLEVGTLSNDLQLKRCPHCGVAHPHIRTVIVTNNMIARKTPGPLSRWGMFACASCGGCMLGQGQPGVDSPSATVVRLFPDARTADAALPERARTYLTQAFETLHAPDAAAVNMLLYRVGDALNHETLAIKGIDSVNLGASDQTTMGSSNRLSSVFDLAAGTR